MNRNFRLTKSTDFERVRRSGKSYAHPFIVLIVLPTEEERTLVGVTASRTLRSSVQRNRAKRLAREAIRPLLAKVKPGCEMILIARSPILNAKFSDVQISIEELLTRAHIMYDSNE